ncbi:Por secretion system C-terminal sorting domain-containing protein [Lishizhenia tianjinensis]|uniref:Por secretion system C-terminal sorting domain-containing protein n=1 Tax=Lishizhenia tianjinensis TaxID=477690 RepID=A0A1I6ZQF7_9FLAO|nr:T9SS type A sorting domain-containing protein [Lishizhenia tianjinensis]SFT64860.1 Por secretion system C-terminal sorting domain-containing protein [Lishizhenia tianjinensis]
MRVFKYILPLCLGAFGALAQTQDLGAPDSWLEADVNQLNYLTMPTVDVAEELAIDSINKAAGYNKTFRFGYEHNVDVDVFNQGQQYFNTNNQRVTQLAIECPDAISINLIFDQFHLAEGTLLYLYNDDKTQFIGAHTSQNNNPNNSLGVDLIYDSKMIIEVIEPQDVIGLSKLHLGTIIHGYKNLAEIAYQFHLKGLNSSGSCNVDVNCPEGGGFERQRDGVAMLVSGSGFCSGSLINCATNTTDSVTPYLLTANHCNTNNVVNAVFRFRWEAPYDGTSCATTSFSQNGGQTMNINGAQLRASNIIADFCLVELNNEPDPAWNVYYSGWDMTGDTVMHANGIHHPSGDIKKFCQEDDPISKVGPQYFNGGNAYFWKIDDWDIGVTEPGSSGSPLFNEEKRIIGVLSAGQAACNGTNDNNLWDIYGRFDVAYDDLADSTDQLKYWLDPNNTGIQFLDGMASNVGLFEENAPQIDFEIYPNPSTGQFEIEVGEINEEKTINIYNALGEHIQSLKSSDVIISINMAQYAKGVYMVEVQQGDQRGVQRLVLQ